MIGKNITADFSAKASEPVIDPSTFVHPLAAVIGNVILGRNILVSPMASIRGDEGQPLFIGDDSNVQDGVVIHALETEMNGKPVEKNLREVGGQRYAVYVGRRVSLAHQAQIHGPAVVMDDTFVGMKSLVFRSEVGPNCVIEPGAILMGVRLARDHGRIPDAVAEPGGGPCEPRTGPRLSRCLPEERGITGPAGKGCSLECFGGMCFISTQRA